MDKERAIIARFANALNGDDGAVLSSRTSRASVNSSLCAKSVSNLNCAGGAIDENIAISKDLFIEDVHFRRSWLTPYQIGAKAAIVNISDAIAMNASPKYALFGLGVPRNMPQKDVSALCDGRTRARRREARRCRIFHRLARRLSKRSSRCLERWTDCEEFAFR